MLVLAALANADRHGYGIQAEVRTLSEGRVRLGTGTLYGALERLLDAGQADVEAAELVREARVVDPEAMQDRGVEVPQVDGVLRDVVAEVVGGAVLDAGLDAATGEPDGEGAAVVVAAH